MSSNIRLQRICQYCKREFTANTTVTKYCGDKCAKRAYKERKRAEKINTSIQETTKIKTKPIEDLKAKEFLSISDVCGLVGVSRRTVYRMIDRGDISYIKIGTRTIIKRSELDNLFEDIVQIKEKVDIFGSDVNLDNYYSLVELRQKMGISDKALYTYLKRFNISRFKKGKFVYVLKSNVDELLSE